jgi:hypothetical protein
MPHLDNSYIGTPGHDARWRRAIMPSTVRRCACLAYCGTWVRMRKVSRTRMLTGWRQGSTRSSVTSYSACTLVFALVLIYVVGRRFSECHYRSCSPRHLVVRFRHAAFLTFAVCDLKRTAQPPFGTQIRKPRCCSSNVSTRLMMISMAIKFLPSTLFLNGSCDAFELCHNR